MPISHSAEFGDVLADGYVAAALTVTTSQIEARVGASRLDGREYLTIHNTSSTVVYYGPSGVTVNTGMPLEKGQTVGIPIGDIGVFLVVSSGSANVRIQEFA